MKIDGACHCGYIRVEGDADPEKTTVCHCTDCQVGNGSAFRDHGPVPGATFRITGQPTGREVQAMHRLQVLTERRSQAGSPDIEELRANPRGDVKDSHDHK